MVGVKSILTRKGSLLFVIIIGVAVGLGILSPVFLTPGNLLDVALQSSINGLISLGMTFVIVSGGIDLSVGAVWALSGAIAAILLRDGFSLTVSILVGLLFGCGCGYVSGLLVAKGGLQPFIATLGMMSVFRGLTLIVTNGYTVYGLPTTFRYIGSGALWGVPIPVFILLAMFFISLFLFTRCTFGRHLMAVGENKEAAWLCGIDVEGVTLKAYVYSGLCASIAAVVATARLGAAEPIAGSGAELDAIAAVVLGGTPLTGGEGNVIGTLLGALLMGMVRNGLTLLNVPTFYQTVIIGLVIIFAVLSESLTLKKSGQ